MKISVVIPVYGCPEALDELHERLCVSLEEITEDYEIILVNDKCPKNSWEGIERICSADRHTVGIDLAYNTGQNRAIMAGLDYCSGDWVVVMDCDLQDRPEDIPELYGKAQEGYDIVFARRTNRSDTPVKVAISKAFYNIYSKVSGQEYDPAIGNFSICSRQVIESYCSMREYHRDFSVYILGIGFRQTAITGHHDRRRYGESSYTMGKKLKLAGEILTSRPDRLFSRLLGFGAILTFAMLILMVIQLVLHISFSDPWGWHDAVIIICFLCGIIITQTSLVGFYVGKTFTQSKNRPLYCVRQILNDPLPDHPKQ